MRVAPALVVFAPERWGQVDKFAKFYAATYTFEKRQARAVDGVRSHFSKAMRLRKLAEKLLPDVQDENRRLNEDGYTHGEASRDVATVLEAGILAVYSSVDCATQVVRAVYGKGARGWKSGTRTTFQGIEKIGGTFPDELKSPSAESAWFEPLMLLRDDLVHLDTGHVVYDEKTGITRYDHFGMRNAGSHLSIPDVFTWFDATLNDVNSFIGRIFWFLNSTLKDEPVFQMCGMVEGRALHRYVSPVGDLTFDSGSCGAWVWFEKPEYPTCPFTEVCGAYGRKAEPEGWETDNL